MKTLIITIVLLMVLSVPVGACIGSRAAGMGYAGVACVNDATAAYWNPSLSPFAAVSVNPNPLEISSKLNCAIPF